MINTGRVFEEFERKSTGMGLEINFNSTIDKKNATIKLSEVSSTP